MKHNQPNNGRFFGVFVSKGLPLFAVTFLAFFSANAQTEPLKDVQSEYSFIKPPAKSETALHLPAGISMVTTTLSVDAPEHIREEFMKKSGGLNYTVQYYNEKGEALSAEYVSDLLEKERQREQGKQKEPIPFVPAN